MALDSANSFFVIGSATKLAASTTSRVPGLILCVLAWCGIVLAQIPGQNPAPHPPSGLKKLYFGFMPRTVTRLELAQVNTHTTTIPTDPLAYRAETGAAPMRGRDYYQYQTQSQQVPYAVIWVKNESNKTVESVDWEFNYPRFKSGKEAVSYRANSRLKIAPGQVVSLAQRLPRDQCSIRYLADRGSTFITSVCGRSTPKTTGTYPVAAEIKRIKFTDGTVWQATP